VRLPGRRRFAGDDRNLVSPYRVDSDGGRKPDQHGAADERDGAVV
jgi:hypothetical protein